LEPVLSFALTDAPPGGTGEVRGEVVFVVSSVCGGAGTSMAASVDVPRMINRSMRRRRADTRAA
jgi:hypothetical protein